MGTHLSIDKTLQQPGEIYGYCICKEQAFKKRALWYNDVEASAIESFRRVSRTIETHYTGILNFFNNRSTNASAESFNAKIKLSGPLQEESEISTFFYSDWPIFA